MIWPKKDQVIIEVPIRAPEDGYPPLEFMVVRKRNLKQVHQVEQLSYLKNFVGAVQPTSLKNSKNDQGGLVVLAESDEAANHIIDSSIGEQLAQFGETHIQEIHITDQKPYNNFPLWFKATLFIDTSSEERLKESAKVVKLLFQIIDKAVSLKLTGNAKQKAEKARKAVERQKQKQATDENDEALIKKNREKHLKFVEQLKQLPPQEQRKLEEKKREKELAKQKKRLSKLVKF